MMTKRTLVDLNFSGHIHSIRMIYSNETKVFSLLGSYFQVFIVGPNDVDSITCGATPPLGQKEKW